MLKVSCDLNFGIVCLNGLNIVLVGDRVQIYVFDFVFQYVLLYFVRIIEGEKSLFLSEFQVFLWVILFLDMMIRFFYFYIFILYRCFLDSGKICKGISV